MYDKSTDLHPISSPNLIPSPVAHVALVDGKSKTCGAYFFNKFCLSCEKPPVQTITDLLFKVSTIFFLISRYSTPIILFSLSSFNNFVTLHPFLIS